MVRSDGFGYPAGHSAVASAWACLPRLCAQTVPRPRFRAQQPGSDLRRLKLEPTPCNFSSARKVVAVKGASPQTLSSTTSSAPGFSFSAMLMQQPLCR
jgi:hypothetical protein